MNLIYRRAKCHTLAAVLLLLTAWHANAKVHFIYIEKKLNEAETIRTIQVIGYKDSSMLFSFVNSNETMQANCRVKFYSENLGLNGRGRPVKDTSLEGTWPQPGEKLLIVMKDKRVVLFAKKEGTNYRFWDPNSIPMANSLFLIPRKPPFLPLGIIIQFDSASRDYWYCQDGCFVDAGFIKERG